MLQINFILLFRLQTEEEARIKAERVAAYKAKKENKSKLFLCLCYQLSFLDDFLIFYSESILTNQFFFLEVIIAKSNIILDVKPWDDTTGIVF